MGCAASVQVTGEELADKFERGETFIVCLYDSSKTGSGYESDNDKWDHTDEWPLLSIDCSKSTVRNALRPGGYLNFLQRDAYVACCLNEHDNYAELPVQVVCKDQRIHCVFKEAVLEERHLQLARLKFSTGTLRVFKPEDEEASGPPDILS